MASDDPSLLAANQRFYSVFRARDVEAMDRLWAREHTTTCTHPGGGPIHGRGEIIESFASIFSTPGSPDLRATAERIVARTVLSALVTCIEHAGPVEVVATNGFVLEAGEWVMVLHHASPVIRPQRASRVGSSTLN